MKRKTFIKQLMGVGISRNTAAVAAEAAARSPIPKAEVLQALMEWRAMFVYNPICAPLIEQVLLRAAKDFIAEEAAA